jgi:hypothetical protein
LGVNLIYQGCVKGAAPYFWPKQSQVVKSSIFIFLFLLVFGVSVHSEEVQESFFDWNLFKNDRGDQMVCYLASTPIKSSSSYKNRGEPFFLVTNIENDADEISVASGFIFKNGNEVELSFGSKKFYLFPYKILAWASDKKLDIEIIKEMQKSSDMVVTSVAENGKIAIDTYSLIGFRQSYQKLQKICR